MTLAAFGLFFVSGAKAQINITNVTEAGDFRELGDSELTTLSFTHETSAGTNRALFVGVSTSADPLVGIIIPGNPNIIPSPPAPLTGTASARVVEVRYNNQPLERVGTRISPNLNNSMEIFRLIAPPVGTYQVQITLNSGLVNNIVAGALSLTGVKQSMPGEDLNFFSNAGPSGTLPNLTIPRGNESLILDVLAASPSAGIVVPGLPGNANGQMEQYNGDNFFFNSYSLGASSSKIPTAGSTTTNWRLTNDSDWALGGVAIVAAAPPTSARVTISGRVIQFSGKGVARALVTLTGMDGETRTAMTNFFGYYHFESVLAGRTYIVSAASKSHLFNPQVITVNENLNGLNFVAGP